MLFPSDLILYFKFQDMIENLIRPNIRTLVAYSSARQEFSGKDEIFLDANENPFGEYNRYPDPFQNQIKTILAHMNQVMPENIFIGNGSDEVIDLVIRIFCKPNEDKILAFKPSYGMYKVSAAINEIGIIELPLTDEFQIDFKLLKKVILEEKPKIIFLCSPNNPTGNLLKNIEEILSDFGGIVFLDEAYIDFSGSESYVKKINKFRNLIVCKTLSKYHGMAGLRIGYCIADNIVINYFNKIKPPYSISQANQDKAIEYLDNSISHFQNSLFIVSERNRIEKELSSIDVVTKIYPSDSNFLLIQVKNATLVYNSLIESNIIVRNRNHDVKNCIRITVGNTNENNQLINALKKIIL